MDSLIVLWYILLNSIVFHQFVIKFMVHFHSILASRLPNLTIARLEKWIRLYFCLHLLSFLNKKLIFNVILCMYVLDVYLSLVNLSTIIPANTLIKKNVPMLMNKKKYIIHTSLLDYIGWKSIPVESMLPHLYKYIN